MMVFSVESRGHLEGVNPDSGLQNIKSVSWAGTVTALSGRDQISLFNFGPDISFTLGTKKQLDQAIVCKQCEREHIRCWCGPAGPGDVVPHLHGGGAPEEREDGGGAPRGRGQVQAPQVPA